MRHCFKLAGNFQKVIAALYQQETWKNIFENPEVWTSSVHFACMIYQLDISAFISKKSITGY